MPKAVALLSGGLDSLLSIIVIKKQGIDVTALTFLTHFGCDISDSSSCSSSADDVSKAFGFTVKLCHLGEKFIEIVKHPKFGHGKNMNPCIDCRILMLREAKSFMEMIGADFVITGEVLGQRPMSQRRDTFPLMDRESGLEGLVLRPLSAKLLKPTIPELKGIVDRERLYGFSGRTRKPQMALAKELGLKTYPSPAGGCLLTDPIYSERLRELLKYNDSPSVNDIMLLRIGRHFRTESGAKIVVSRDMHENTKLLNLVQDGDLILKLKDRGGPIVIIR
ncbi:MAG: hypothetical protein D6828_06305, partial [Nitrospirae bacterium]